MAEKFHRLPDQKYTEAEFLFKTIEMAKSDEDYDIELNPSPPPTTDFFYSWKRRQRPHRRYTVGAPPAPPSTPTSLTANNTPTPSPTASNVTAADEEPPMRGILQRVPKYKKKLRELQRTDAELADMLNVVTITNSGASRSAKLQPERGVNLTSRVIRKQDSSTKIFKIHRNPKEFYREPGDEEDSVSAPEYDITYDYARYRRRMKSRSRRVARLRHEERMETLVSRFDTTMGFNDA